MLHDRLLLGLYACARVCPCALALKPRRSRPFLRSHSSGSWLTAPFARVVSVMQWSACA